MYQILFKVYGDDGITPVAYLGGDADTNEMRLSLNSKSKTDKRGISMMIDASGGKWSCFNKAGSGVAGIGVGSDDGGVLITFDRYGNVRDGHTR